MLFRIQWSNALCFTCVPANSSTGERVSQIMDNANWIKLDNKFIIFKRKQHKQSKYFNFLNI